MELHHQSKKFILLRVQSNNFKKFIMTYFPFPICFNYFTISLIKKKKINTSPLPHLLTLYQTCYILFHLIASYHWQTIARASRRKYGNTPRAVTLVRDMERRWRFGTPLEQSPPLEFCNIGFVLLLLYQRTNISSDEQI